VPYCPTVELLCTLAVPVKVSPAFRVVHSMVLNRL